jgi:hypothetical protein
LPCQLKRLRVGEKKSIEIRRCRQSAGVIPTALKNRVPCILGVRIEFIKIFLIARAAPGASLICR